MSQPGKILLAEPCTWFRISLSLYQALLLLLTANTSVTHQDSMQRCGTLSSSKWRHLFFTFSNVSTFTLRIFISEIGSLLHWLRFFPDFPSSGWSSARVEWQTYCVISPTCPDVRIQGSGSQVSDIWGGSTIPIQFTFCPFWRQWLNLVNFGKGEQWEANGQTNSPMLSKYIDMFYTHVQLAHKAAMILK